MAGYPPPYPPPGPPPGHDWKYQRRILKDQARAQRDMIRAQRDAYRAQYRAMRRGSIVGPLLIVAIGIVFLLVQTGHLRSYSLWAWYGRWWPLLLVCVGIVLLIEWAFDRSAAQREGNIPYVRHRVGGGVIFSTHLPRHRRRDMGQRQRPASRHIHPWLQPQPGQPRRVLRRQA